MNIWFQIQKLFVSLNKKFVTRRLKLAENEIKKLRAQAYVQGMRDAYREFSYMINWKPDSDQIDALRHACYTSTGKQSFLPLFTLYKQLRKLYFVENG